MQKEIKPWSIQHSIVGYTKKWLSVKEEAC